MDINKILEFIGSKWFMLGLGIAMIFILPTAYSNFMIVFNAGEMSRLWWVPTVFICNLITAFIAFYKATEMFFQKKDTKKEDWE